MSTKEEIEQFRTNINAVMSHYTRDILKHVNVATRIQQYIDNYTPGTSALLTIKINITNPELIKMVDDINDHNLIKTSTYFDFCSFRYNTNKQVFLLKENLDQYIDNFLPHWNSKIVDHYIIIGKHNFYYLKIEVPIGTKIEGNIISPLHDDPMNNIYCNYVKNQIEQVILYVIDEINMEIKKNIVLKKETLINIIDYLCELSTMIYTNSFVGYRKEVDYMNFKQKNMINILKTTKVPTKFRTFDYLSKVHILIKYIYHMVEEHYKSQNITITRLSEKVIDFEKYGDSVYFASHKIEL